MKFEVNKCYFLIMSGFPPEFVRCTKNSNVDTYYFINNKGVKFVEFAADAKDFYVEATELTELLYGF